MLLDTIFTTMSSEPEFTPKRTKLAEEKEHDVKIEQEGAVELAEPRRKGVSFGTETATEYQTEAAPEDTARSEGTAQSDDATQNHQPVPLRSVLKVTAEQPGDPSVSDADKYRLVLEKLKPLLASPGLVVHVWQWPCDDLECPSYTDATCSLSCRQQQVSEGAHGAAAEH
jgi:hypothetical protein